MRTLLAPVTFRRIWLLLAGCLALAGAPALPAEPAPRHQLFARTNLMAWCIVPFDAKKRGPEERAAMLEKLGFKHYAYDYRAEHIPTFDTEILACRKHGVSFDAWWFPTALNDEARLILDVLKRHNVKAQLWVTGAGGPTKTPEEQRARVDAEAKRIRAIAEAAAPLGCTVALYNHGNWFGEPENQLEIIQRLKQDGITKVGLVYNLHHGHEHLERFTTLLQQMKPHLLVLNLNGMTRDGEKAGKKILPLGQGDLDLKLLRIIRDSGWRGPIGILNHTDEDAEARLQDNLDGLDWLVPQLDGKAPGPKPKPRSWREPALPGAPRASSGQASLSPAFGQALNGGMVVDGATEYRTRPLTVECRAKLNSKAGFNILVASDPKASAEHWELYTYAGSGVLSLYQPGRGGEVRSDLSICDGCWHAVAAVIEPERVRLFVDGKLVKDAVVATRSGTARPGGLAFGTLVEGGIGCDGLIDDVRLSRGAREISGVSSQPLRRDAQTLGLWNFDDLKASIRPPPEMWAVEDAAARAALPEFRELPAAPVAELTVAAGWHRSLGDATSSRFSALAQINRATVNRLEVAWTYHSQDGTGNVQCNPIVVDGVLFAPTAGHHVVALNAATGVEQWRFKPELRRGALRLEDAPARRGLLYWAGDQVASVSYDMKAINGSVPSGTKSPSGQIFYSAYWDIRDLDVRGNTYDFYATDSATAALPRGLSMAGLAESDIPPYLFPNFAWCDNIVRHIDGHAPSVGADPNSYGIKATTIGRATIQQNVIDAGAASPLSYSFFGAAHHLHNRTANGALIRGFNEQNQLNVADLETRIAELETLSYL
jgi:sugar phosphate isomerase/epimerase